MAWTEDGSGDGDGVWCWEPGESRLKDDADLVTALAKGLSRGYVYRSGSWPEYARQLLGYIDAVINNRKLDA